MNGFVISHTLFVVFKISRLLFHLIEPTAKWEPIHRLYILTQTNAPNAKRQYNITLHVCYFWLPSHLNKMSHFCFRLDEFSTFNNIPSPLIIIDNIWLRNHCDMKIFFHIILWHSCLFIALYIPVNKVIGTRRQGVRVWCPRELTPEHLTEASLWLEEPLRDLASLQLEEPLSGFQAFWPAGLG